jgi:hypothetical protein
MLMTNSWQSMSRSTNDGVSLTKHLLYYAFGHRVGRLRGVSTDVEREAASSYQLYGRVDIDSNITVVLAKDGFATCERPP